MLLKSEIDNLYRILRESPSQDERQAALKKLLENEQQVLQQLQQEFSDDQPLSPADEQAKNLSFEQLIQRRDGQVQQAGQSEQPQIAPLRPHPWHKGRLLRVAAIFLLLIGGISLKFLFNKKPAGSQPLASTTTVTDTLFNRTPKIQQIALADGSSVDLHPGSAIYYDTTSPKKRVVYLKGTAQFTVKNNPHRPFSVYAGNMELRDLGTVFLVDNRMDSLKVELMTGSVLLHALNKTINLTSDILMKPGDIFRLDKQGGRYSMLEKADRKMTPPKPKPATTPAPNLNLQNAPLTEVFALLGAKFHKRIIYDRHKLNDKTFSGNLSHLTQIDNAVRLVCIPNNFQYEIRGDTILIH